MWRIWRVNWKAKSVRSFGKIVERVIYGVIFQISRHSSGLLLAGLIQVELIKGYEFERHMLYHMLML